MRGRRKGGGGGGGGSFKRGRSLNSLAVMMGAHSKGAFIYAGALFQINTVDPKDGQNYLFLIHISMAN